jgi:hypothetical protein
MWSECCEIRNIERMSLYFDNFEAYLLDKIATWGAGKLVVGCIAWLSNKTLLEALMTHCKYVLIIVNDENYGHWGGGSLPARYDGLPRMDHPLYYFFQHLSGPLGMLERERDPASPSSYAPVRCYGNPTAIGGAPAAVKGRGTERRQRADATAVAAVNVMGIGKGHGRVGIVARKQHAAVLDGCRTRTKGGPLMHSKYLVFFGQAPCTPPLSPSVLETAGDLPFEDVPMSVWSGSMNWTHRSQLNQEHASFVPDHPQLALAYFNDFAQTFMQSYPLVTR